MSLRASIVVTCYNLERYIADAIRSIVDQAGGELVEIIVVDDCSTDGSAAIIRTFPQVRYLQTPGNSGVLLATLHGIEAATQDIVFLMDGDDVWEADKLRLALAAFDADKALGLLTHDLTFVDANNSPIQRISRCAEELSPLPADRLSEALRHGILSLSDYVWLGSALGLRRSVMDFDGFAAWARALPDPRHTYQDWPLAYWSAAQPEVRLGYLKDKLFRYRLHGANHSGDARDLDKALRNLRRSWNTTVAMHQIALIHGVARHYRRLAERHNRFNLYLVRLYEGRRLVAAGGFLTNLPFLALRPRLLAKETVRMGLISLIGARRFTTWRGSRAG
ncbi:MAG TPA: glycosyltransferase [Sphingomonas sp.]|jgi:glycosyltransferase involved in cell wall biosynthesis